MCSTLVDERLDSKIHGRVRKRPALPGAGAGERSAGGRRAVPGELRPERSHQLRRTRPRHPRRAARGPGASSRFPVPGPRAAEWRPGTVEEPPARCRHQARPGRCNLFGMSGLGRFLTLPTCSTLVDGRPDSKIRDRRGRRGLEAPIKGIMGIPDSPMRLAPPMAPARQPSRPGDRHGRPPAASRAKDRTPSRGSALNPLDVSPPKRLSSLSLWPGRCRAREHPKETGGFPNVA